MYCIIHNIIVLIHMVIYLISYHLQGQETTAGMLSFTVLALCQHPEILLRYVNRHIQKKKKEKKCPSAHKEFGKGRPVYHI